MWKLGITCQRKVSHNLDATSEKSPSLIASTPLKKGNLEEMVPMVPKETRNEITSIGINDPMEVN